MQLIESPAYSGGALFPTGGQVQYGLFSSVKHIPENFRFATIIIMERTELNDSNVITALPANKWSENKRKHTINTMRLEMWVTYPYMNWFRGQL